MPSNPPRTNRATPIGFAGDGSLNYVDMHDLKPRSELAATLSGGLSGLVTGSIASGFIALLSRDAKGRMEISPRGIMGALAFTAVTTAVGAVIGNVNARVHNKFSDRMVANYERQLESHAQRVEQETGAAQEGLVR